MSPPDLGLRQVHALAVRAAVVAHAVPDVDAGQDRRELAARLAARREALGAPLPGAVRVVRGVAGQARVVQHGLVELDHRGRDREVEEVGVVVLDGRAALHGQALGGLLRELAVPAAVEGLVVLVARLARERVAGVAGVRHRLLVDQGPRAVGGVEHERRVAAEVRLALLRLAEGGVVLALAVEADLAAVDARERVALRYISPSLYIYIYI